MMVSTEQVDLFNEATSKINVSNNKLLKTSYEFILFCK